MAFWSQHLRQSHRHLEPWVRELFHRGSVSCGCSEQEMVGLNFPREVCKTNPRIGALEFRIGILVLVRELLGWISWEIALQKKGTSDNCFIFKANHVETQEPSRLLWMKWSDHGRRPAHFIFQPCHCSCPCLSLPTCLRCSHVCTGSPRKSQRSYSRAAIRLSPTAWPTTEAPAIQCPCVQPRPWVAPSVPCWCPCSRHCCPVPMCYPLGTSLPVNPRQLQLPWRDATKPFGSGLRWGDRGWALGTARLAGLGRERAAPVCHSLSTLFSRQSIRLYWGFTTRKHVEAGLATYRVKTTPFRVGTQAPHASPPGHSAAGANRPTIKTRNSSSLQSKPDCCP